MFETLTKKIIDVYEILSGIKKCKLCDAILEEEEKEEKGTYCKSCLKTRTWEILRKHF